MTAPRSRRSPPAPSRGAAALLMLLAVTLVTGCRLALPTYPETEPQESLRIIASRLASVRTIQSSATIEFEEAEGAGGAGTGGVRLDGVLVARFPDSLRLRAWKFDRAVFDATLRDGELWLLPVDKEVTGDRADDSKNAAEGVRRAFSFLTAAFYESAVVDEARTTPRELVVNGQADGDVLSCVIDRATLTPRRFEQSGDGAGQTLTIELEDYRLIDRIPWPGAWVISHPRGTVTIRMHDVVLNGDLSPGAFVPPQRAVLSR